MTITRSVLAMRWGQGWELHIQDIGVTQCENLRDAEVMVRDYLEVEGHDPRATLVFSRHFGDGLDYEVIEDSECES